MTAKSEGLEGTELCNCPGHKEFVRTCRECWSVSADWNCLDAEIKNRRPEGAK